MTPQYDSILTINQIIPCVGIESAPADLLAWATVKRVREDLSCHTRSITGDIHEIK